MHGKEAVMNLVSLEEAKTYLRVDSSDDDPLITSLLASAGHLCKDVARLSDEKWSVIDSDAESSDIYTVTELVAVREILKVAILYTIGYLYEHREEADHHDLVLTLRCLLFALREGVL